jgi:2-polyprenyl-3-methyl-5-hydroxy-6-metoxy-1,4-benzoquinol methylase
MSSDAQWRKWAQTEPYFAVIVDEKFKKESLSANLDQFFALGEKSIQALIDRADKFCGPLGREKALDFGCGVGRLTMPLARRFGSVVGVDISSDMLKEAQRNCAGNGISNAQFVLSDDNLSQVSQQFDFVVTSMVLQHIPEDRGMQILNRLLESVKLGGCAAIHLSILRSDDTWTRIRYFIKHNFPVIDALRNGLMGKGFSSLTMRMTEYDLAQVTKLFEAHDMAPIMVIPSYHVKILTCFLIAQKRVPDPAAEGP